MFYSVIAWSVMAKCDCLCDNKLRKNPKELFIFWFFMMIVVLKKSQIEEDKNNQLLRF